MSHFDFFVSSSGPSVSGRSGSGSAAYAERDRESVGEKVERLLTEHKTARALHATGKARTEWEDDKFRGSASITSDSASACDL